MTEYVLSLSYGKDSLACLGAIEQLGLPLDRIVHAEVWATDTIPADLPPMIEFKEKADRIIKDRYGIVVEHIRSDNYENLFYTKIKPETIAKRKEKPNYRQYNNERHIWGFPIVMGAWCTGRLKENVMKKSLVPKGATNKVVQYLGIALDETKRVQRHIKKPNIILPLVEIGWDEPYCRKWCEENDLLSPIYTTATRGGCWFCHNQSIDQLRFLRKNYPDLWKLLLKWDNDSPVTFKSDGHTVHDFDKRFALEDEGIISENDPWRWAYLEDLPIQLQLKF